MYTIATATRYTPTPASNKLYVTADKYNIGELTLLTATGSVVMRKTLTGHNNEADLNALAAGMYLYQITSPDGHILQTGKVQVTR
jgi:hypothetical protein